MIAIGRTHLATDFRVGPSDQAKFIRKALNNQVATSYSKTLNDMVFATMVFVSSTVVVLTILVA